MIIRPALASRLIYAVAGTGATLGFVGLTIVIVLQGGGAASVFGLFLVAIFAFITYWGTRGSVLRADQAMVAYRPAVGKTRTVSRSELASIDRVRDSEGGPLLSFRSKDGTELFRADETYRRTEIEALARYLGVPAHW